MIMVTIRFSKFYFIYAKYYIGCSYTMGGAVVAMYTVVAHDLGLKEIISAENIHPSFI